MGCDVGKATEGLENGLKGGSTCHLIGIISAVKDVRPVVHLHGEYSEERLKNEQSSFSKLSVTSPTSQLILILQAFHHFPYVTAHSPTLPSLYLHHNPFSNPSVASPTSQLILQPFPRFTYVTGFSLTSPGEPPMVSVRFLLC